MTKAARSGCGRYGRVCFGFCVLQHLECPEALARRARSGTRRAGYARDGALRYPKDFEPAPDAENYSRKKSRVWAGAAAPPCRYRISPVAIQSTSNIWLSAPDAPYIAGIIPSCWSIPRSSRLTQCSTTLPFSIRSIAIPVIVTNLPVGGMPINGPVCVPLNVRRRRFRRWRPGSLDCRCHQRYDGQRLHWLVLTRCLPEMVMLAKMDSFPDPFAALVVASGIAVNALPAIVQGEWMQANVGLRVSFFNAFGNGMCPS